MIACSYTEQYKRKGTVMERDEYLQVRMTEEEKSLAKQLASDYGLKGGASEMVRLALNYIYVNRPALTIRIVPKKAVAPSLN